MKNQIIRFSILVFAVTVLSACDLEENPPMAAAKSICSCLYVSKRSIHQCKFQFKRVLMFASYQLKKKERAVIGESNTKWATARFVSEKYGCQIVSFEDKPEEEDDWSNQR